MKTFKFHHFDVIMYVGHYHDGKPLIAMISAATNNNRSFDVFSGEVIAKCTVNVTDRLAPGTVAIKSWSENVGMLAFFEDNDIGMFTGEVIQQGFEHADVIRLSEWFREKHSI